jgi:hypothetical protein
MAACAEHQVCREGQDADATCLETCEPGFVWNAGRCDAVAGATCEAGAEGSIADQCAALSRRCLANDQGAECGACLDGTTDEGGAMMACRPFATCESLGCAGQGRACLAGAADEDAACGDCLDGFHDQGGACAPDAPPTCAPQGAGSIAARCAAQHRECQGADGAASCGGCLAGFADQGGACVMSPPSCDPGTPVRQTCDAAFRECRVQGAVAACGDCQAGLVDVGGRCVSEVCDAAACMDDHRTCENAPPGGCGHCMPGFDLSDPDDPAAECLPHQTCEPNPCMPNEVCHEQLMGLPPTCDANGCAEGEAVRQTVVDGMVIASECVACQIVAEACQGEGETGRVYPYTVENGDRCFCETRHGYFVNDNDFTAQPCDADGDGWVNVTAATYLSPNADRHLRENARCDLVRVDRVELADELGAVLPLSVCQDGAARFDAGGHSLCAHPARIPLYEDEATDSPDDPFLSGDRNPPYGDGRRFRAAELNPLTRACIAGADVNANGALDVLEAQDTVPRGYNANLEWFVRFAYFVELYRSEVVSRVSDNPCQSDDDCGSDTCAGGRCAAQTLRISERPRGDAAFPVRYLDTDDEYWRSCLRRRDATWDDDPDAPGGPGRQNRAGLDFAEWTCDAATGSCPTPPPVARMPADAFTATPPHGVADTGPAERRDGPWLGMGHPSQFKCVQVVDNIRNLDPRAAPYERHTDAFTGASPELTFDRCALRGDAVECAAVPGDQVHVGDVGLAAVRYADRPGDYLRGCIDEWLPEPMAGDGVARVKAWREMCPGYFHDPDGLHGNPNGVRGVADRTRFGELLCGCSTNTGGERCEIGCAEALRGAAGATGEECTDTGYCILDTPDHAGRVGYWMCAHPETTSNASDDPDAPPWLEAGGFTLRGGGFPSTLRSNPLQPVMGEANPEGWGLR